MKPQMKENFLQRWSRLKRDPPTVETPPTPPASPEGSPSAPTSLPLPEIDSLEFSSDFTAFMADRVDAGLRRGALQKLFHAEHFNVMDGLDTYIDDYNTFEPISEEMLKNLNQARGLLFDDDKTAAETPEVQPIGTSSPGIDADPPDEAPATQDLAMDKSQ